MATGDAPHEAEAAGAPPPFVASGSCAATTANDIPLDPALWFTAGGRGQPFNSPTGVPWGAWGFLTDCAATSCALKYTAHDVPQTATEVARCGGKGQPSCEAILGLPQGTVQTCSGGNGRIACKIGYDVDRPEASRFWWPWGSTEERVLLDRRAECCMGIPAMLATDRMGALRRGCPSDHCAGSTQCRSFATRYCLGEDPSTPGVPRAATGSGGGALCAALGQWGEDGRRQRADVMRQACFTPDGEPQPWFRAPGCLQWCRDDPEACEDAGLRAHCAKASKLGVDPATNKLYDTDICACSYPIGVYTAFQEQVKQQFGIPDGVLDARPFCAYPDCPLCRTAPTVPPECRPVNLASCVQHFTIDNRGTIGDIVVNQNCFEGTKCSQPADCPVGLACVNGACSAGTGSRCGPGTVCPGLFGHCANGACSTDPPVVLVVGAVLFAVALLVGAVLLVRRGRGRKRANG